MMRRVCLLTTVNIVLLSASSVGAAAQELTVSAKLDKTSAEIGEPVNLTLTLSGDLTDAQLVRPTWPQGIAVAASSQSSNFSIRNGVVDRSTAVLFVLVPQQAGTFQVGPFTIQQHDRTIKTDSIELTVKKPALPPRLSPDTDRFIL